ncbi:P-loop containing nucleoside triphosphate hydrolase protein [Lasiosphaeria hispida]|uniref:P-loop containing nucleoside triphosphate hydrolase protein n=1 Tax=Lasiosphaeria hispida TaxID=260671 RepID=A0AAJ0HAC3_9PEZI|nr:P-loop containing nucleoside triphosphate hydrolase protein [Lasiosphaeria hispida]
MTLTRLGDDDHGFAAYRRAFLKSQKGLDVAEEEQVPPPSDNLRDGDSNQNHPARDPFGDSGLEPPAAAGPGSGSRDNSRPNTRIQVVVPPVPKIQVFGEHSELIPTIRAQDDHAPPRSFDEIGRNSTSQNNEHQLEIANLADDAYSEAEQSFVEKQSRRGRPSWFRKRPGYDSDSDKSEKVGAKGDPDDEAYDSDLVSELEAPGGTRHVAREHTKKMRKWSALATNRFENMLLECIVNTDKIPPKYENIFIQPSIIRELERVTRLSLDRPKAFSRGVLKGNRVTGAILYGPPGTGKTILAKGLAKEAGCNMLAISTAELWQKCHGEDEKVIKAVFSLGRKLFPCIVFLDEADAMLGARKAGEKRHIRSMLNQFLMEWDGLMSGLDSPFILLATNRPFDLDPAVLRRAPVHIHIDVPTLWERQKILELLLKGEDLAKGCDAATLAKYTHKYTGSDLKNLCVTAATLCVDQQRVDTEERVLTAAHFQQAMKTVRPTALGSTMRNEFAKFDRKEPVGNNGGEDHGTVGRRGHGHEGRDEDDD